MSLRLRFLVLFLAALPLVWSYCPCCMVGSGCGTVEASTAAASAPAKKGCACCRRKAAEASRAHEAPTKPQETPPASPKDCDGCAASYARAGALTAPPAVALPAFDLVAVVLPTDVPDAMRAFASAPITRTGGPAPPGSRVWLLETVVLTI